MKEIRLKSNNRREEFSFSTIGAGIDYWLLDGKPVIYSSCNVGKKKRGGCPICFPFFGSPPEVMNGFGKHGWLRGEEFQFFHMTKGGYGTKLVFESIPTLPRREQYPWFLKYEVEYIMLNRTLTINFRIKRPGHDAAEGLAPINPAFHPYFPVSTVNIGAYSPNFSGTAHIESVNNFEALAPIIIKTKDFVIEMSLQGFEILCFWSENPERFVCVEPVAQSPDFFNTDGGLSLEKGESRKFSMELRVLEIL